jgi:ubiquinone/menaquinone biosynthesis C-methylase UbiE
VVNALAMADPDILPCGQARHTHVHQGGFANTGFTRDKLYLSFPRRQATKSRKKPGTCHAASVAMVVSHEKDRDMQLDAHKSAVAKAYGLASAGYNKPALKFFSQGAEALVDFADLSRGQRILDVATGTGHAALYAGLKVGADHGSVVGIDIAKEMVHLANASAKTLSRGNVRFELMDGEHTTFADDEFDAVLCSYGIFFLPDMANGLTEWKRVAKSGGWVCFSAFGDTAFQPQSDLFEQRIRYFGPLIRDKKRPFGWQRLVEPQALVALLDHAGMTNVEVREVNLDSEGT